MKKIIIYTLVILLLVIITVSGTYAFFTARIGSEENSLSPNANKFEVIYKGGENGEEITGKLKLANQNNKEMGATLEIRISEESIAGTANIYIQIDEITEDIANKALNWEVYKTFNGKEELAKQGNFEDCETDSVKRACKSGDKLYVIKDYPLSTTNTAFTVYIWLNGNLVGNEVVDDKFKGHIGAETEKITGDLG